MVHIRSSTEIVVETSNYEVKSSAPLHCDDEAFFYHGWLDKLAVGPIYGVFYRFEQVKVVLNSKGNSYFDTRTFFSIILLMWNNFNCLTKAPTIALIALAFTR